MNLKALGVSALAACLAGSAFSQGTKPVAVIALDKASVVAGGTVSGKITVTFPAGYHAYQNPPTEEFEIPVKIEAVKGSLFKLTKVTYPAGTPQTVPGADKPSAVYTDTIVVPFTVKAPAKAGATKIALSFDYQECNESTCLPPDTINLTAKITIQAATKKPKKKG